MTSAQIVGDDVFFGGQSPAPPPPAAALQGGPPSSAAPGQAAPSPPITDPAGARSVTPVGAGVWEDKIGRVTSAPDLGPNYYRGDDGKTYYDASHLAPGAVPPAPATAQASSPVSTPSPSAAPVGKDPVVGDDVFFGEQGQSVPETTEASGAPSLAGDAGQAARGLFGMVESGGDQIANIASGAPAFLLRTASGASDQIADLLRGALADGSPPRHIDLNNPAMDASTALSQPPTPFLNPGRAQIDQWAAAPPRNLQESAARALGVGAGVALFPVGGEAKLAETAADAVPTFLQQVGRGAGAAARFGRTTAVGAAGAGAGQIATNYAPEPLKPLANILGGAAGAALTHEGIALAEGQSANPAVAGLPGPVGRGAANRQAAADIIAKSSDPEAIRSAPIPPPIVEGSQPTTAEAFSDPGLAARQANSAQGPFQARAAEQTAARVAALKNVGSGGDPAHVASAIAGQLDQIDAAHEAQVNAAVVQAQSKANAIGGQGSPETYGADLRAKVAAADAARHTAASQLYDAIDPDGTATGNVSATKRAASKVLGQMLPTSAPMSGEEANAFQAATQMPNVAPLRMLTELRSNVGAQLRDAQGPAKGRLSQLYGAIQDNLSQTIADKVQSERAQVAAGQLAPEQTIDQRAAALGEKWGVPAQARARVGNSSSGSGYVSGGTASVPGVGGTGTQAQRGPGIAPGPQGLPSEPGQPTVTPEQLGSLNAASGAYKAYKQDTAGPVSDALATVGSGGLYRTPDGALPSKYFRPGPKAFTDIQSLLKVSPEAAPVLADYAALSLRRAATTPNGIDPAGFASWQAKHQDALRALPPQVQAKFSDAATATQAVGDAMVARKQAITNAKMGALGKLAGKVDDPDGVVSVVDRTLHGESGAVNMSKLAAALKGNPQASAGLHQAVVESVANRLVGIKGGAETLSGDKLTGYLRGNRKALSAVLSPTELGSLDRIVQDIHRSQTTAVSGKVGKEGFSDQVGHAAAAAGGHGAQSLMGLLLGGAFGHVLGLPEHIGEISGAALSSVASGLKMVGVARRDQLVTEALLHPEVAKRLLQRYSPKNATAIQSGMRGAIAAIGSANGAPLAPVYGSVSTPQP